MDDKMNRQLKTFITIDDSSLTLAQELVHYGFINEVSTKIYWVYSYKN